MISRPIQKLHPLQIASKENKIDKNGKDSSTRVSSKEEPIVSFVLDFFKSNLNGGETEGRTIFRRANAVDGEIRRKLVQMYKEENSDDDRFY